MSSNSSTTFKTNNENIQLHRPKTAITEPPISTMNKPPIKEQSVQGIDLQNYNTLASKTIEEIKEVHNRGRRLLVRKRTFKRDPYAIPTPPPKSEEELKLEAIQREKDIKELAPQIHYSDYYYDEEHEYRHVILPRRLVYWLPHRGLLKEQEWVKVGVSQSTGWENYMQYAPEPHILCFRREIYYLKKYGKDNAKVRPTSDTTNGEENETEGEGQKEEPADKGNATDSKTDNAIEQQTMTSDSAATAAVAATIKHKDGEITTKHAASHLDNVK